MPLCLVCTSCRFEQRILSDQASRMKEEQEKDEEITSLGANTVGRASAHGPCWSAYEGNTKSREPTRPPVRLHTARVGMRNFDRFVGFGPFQLRPGAFLTLYC